MMSGDHFGKFKLEQRGPHAGGWCGAPSHQIINVCRLCAKRLEYDFTAISDLSL
jgi:hypothetical protein